MGGDIQKSFAGSSRFSPLLLVAKLADGWIRYVDILPSPMVNELSHGERCSHVFASRLSLSYTIYNENAFFCYIVLDYAYFVVLLDYV